MPGVRMTLYYKDYEKRSDNSEKNENAFGWCRGSLSPK